MYFRNIAISFLSVASLASAFTGNHVPSFGTTRKCCRMFSSTEPNVDGLNTDILKEINYKAGTAPTAFAKRYGHLAGARVKTVGEAFAEFTEDFGLTVNALYKNMVTDIVGTTHLIVVNARFQKDAIWSLGIMTALDLLLKNYPEKEVGERIVSSLFKCIGMDEAEVRAEAQSIHDWCQGKSLSDIEAALNGEEIGDSNSPPLVASIARSIKSDEFWMYSRYFGIGLIKVLENVGVEMDKDEVYPIMENLMSNKLGKSHLTACSDSDLYFKTRSKLEMMETMMKEIEIREKKRMAERLEEKAQQALRLADKEAKMAEEIEAEAAKNRELIEA